MNWDPQLENGVPLKEAEAPTSDLIMTPHQIIPYQQTLTVHTPGLVVLGSNIWPIVHANGATFSARGSAPAKRL